MGIRESLNENRVGTAVVAGIVILGALTFVLREACAPSGEEARRLAKEYFSVDDGKTWFAEYASKLPPFEHEGKTAYRAKVFKCSDGKEFVSHLERYDDADKRKLEAAAAKAAQPRGPAAMVLMMLAGSVEVKKPGDKDWVQLTPETAERHHRTMQAKCPDGSTVDIRPVLPQ